MRRLSKRRQLLLRWSVAGALAVAIPAALLVILGSRPDPAAVGEDGRIAGLTNVLAREASGEQATIRMDEVAESAGVRFHHFPAERGSLLPEDMGSGLAWGDYDDDGDPDLFLVNFSAPITASLVNATATSRLYRNDGGRFEDVTEQAGIADAVWGMGAAWGDFENDGDLDLYMTCYGPNRLYRNNGDGTFTDTSREAGVDDPGFGAGCSWMDYNRDGHLDLYVCNYVEFERRNGDQERFGRQYGSEIPYTLNPSSYRPAANRLYRNNGDGTFVDVAAEAGVANPDGRSLSASWADLDRDGWPDLYIANDVSNNAVYRNLGDGTFRDIGAESLAADYRGAMGVAVGDPDADGDQDLFVTHWLAQENAFLMNNVAESDDLRDTTPLDWLFFTDRADEFGLGQNSIDMVGWGTGFGDFDNDGLVDLWVVNGSTLEDPEDTRRLVGQPFQFFRQVPERGFYEIAARIHPEMAVEHVGRGGAQADMDGDGLLDIAVNRHGGRALLYRNVSDATGSWLAVRLRQSGGNTRALGAQVQVVTGQRIQTVQSGVSSGYLSQNGGDLHFGLGNAARVDAVIVRWPDGVTNEWRDIDANRVLLLEHEAQYADLPYLAQKDKE